jgi:hypothetical protein
MRKIIEAKRREESFMEHLRLIGPAPVEGIGPQAGERDIPEEFELRARG